MEFTRLDGSVFNYHFFPPEIFDGYEHFFIFQSGNSPDCLLFLFNGRELNFRKSGTTFLIDAGSSSIQVYRYKSSTYKLVDLGLMAEVNPGSSNSLVVLSDSLLPYSADLLSCNASIVLPEIELPEIDSPVIEQATFTLRPIIEEQKDDYSDVFNEVFGILPVLLVALISFIGIRKGISWLSSLLRRS